MDTKDEIAIVGIGCNFPGGEGIDNFWRVLVEGRNCVVEIPPERFESKSWYDPDSHKPGKTSTRHAAFTEEFNAFDNRLFGINDVEAERMDPQQKLLLECTYRALEDAGVPRENISGSKTGVFVGMMNQDYRLMNGRTPTEASHYDGTGTAMSIAANRISYTFNLTGPSVAIDTACSSFSYALHFALHAIKQGDCEAALCGGVSCIMEPQVFVALSKAKMLSPEGVSKPFSIKADGYGRGEGCGVILLKSLKKAQEDFSKIWGVINVSAVNQNGRSVTPITRPSQEEQEKLLLSIYPERVDPSVVQYIEAHGTGTPAGDPVEAESLASFLGNALQANYAAANSFLDLFCQFRRNCGLSGQSINWGALNLGLLDGKNQLQKLVESKGISILQVDEIHENLKTSLTLNHPQQAAVKLNFKTMINNYYRQIPAIRSRLHTIMIEHFGSQAELFEQATSKDLAALKSEDYIISLVSQLTSTDPSDIAMNTPLLSLGIDSMLAMTLRNLIYLEQKVDIPLVKILDPHSTVPSLALLLEECSKEPGEPK
ncbi:phthiocerol phenolphthiocerol synthesis polyketide synthase type I [Podarcis lilfordi]|uniref:Phthiocerol phenolphthiocerol synthesis polyketide synthase type I n=1 Tax=Podarcis lilfordi TaxID=74358 RepID=A0AA35L447_9SAUR|nr:phthiocerol phenolphthiocerol synthesis polyketide synthase type I [Podarcis lilfordi]